MIIGEYDPIKSPQQYPLPLAKYGANPYGEPLYRIVLASTVRKLVGGQWPDGRRYYTWLPAYPHLRVAWVLECWRKPSPATWKPVIEPLSGWPVNGPYPERGEYLLAWEFDKGVAADNIEKIIGAIEYGRNRSVQDLDDFNRAEYQAEEKDTRRNAYDEIRDCFTAYGGRAFASALVARGIKTITPLKTAEECGLPVPRAAPATPKRIGMRTTADVRDIEVRTTLTAGR